MEQTTSQITEIPHETLRDGTLSFKARGLLAYLLSFPDGAAASSETIAEHNLSDGRDSIRAGLRELERAGYLTRHRKQDGDGRFRWVCQTHPLYEAVGREESE